MKHDKLVEGADYFQSGKPATELSHYSIKRVRVLSVGRWRENSGHYGGKPSRISLGGRQYNVFGQPDPERGQYVLVIQVNLEDGKPLPDPYANAVQLVHMNQLRGTWDELGPQLLAHRQAQADAAAEAKVAATQLRELVDSMRDRSEHLLGRPVGLTKSGRHSVVLDATTLSELLALIPVETP